LKSDRPPAKRGNENQNERRTIDPRESKSQLVSPKPIDNFQDVKKQRFSETGRFDVPKNQENTEKYESKRTLKNSDFRVLFPALKKLKL
jgi:hypothetical protein